MCEAVCAKYVYIGELSENLSWKLENGVTTIYKTLSNINIVFSNCLQMRYTCAFLFIYLFFLLWMAIWL